MLRTIVCLLCVYLGFTSPLPQDLELRSLGGKQATEGQFPWQVALFMTEQYDSTLRFVCGGSIISREWILTAGHCLYTATSVRVLAGTILNMHHAQDLTNAVVAKFWKTHERYDDEWLLNDIGIIRITYPLIFDQNIRSIKLSSQIMLPVNSSIITSGWGSSSDDFLSFPIQLRYVELVTISGESSEYCQYQGNSAFCAVSGTREPKSVCMGDSGGPSVIYVNGNPVLVGITSLLNPSGIFCGWESGFANVAYYRDWIWRNTMM